MRARRPFKPSPAIVISSLAILVSLSGTGVAAVSALPRNSVGAAQLRNNAVVPAKVKNGSLRAVDVKAGQAPAGPVGPAGAAGPVGPAGTAGPKGDRGDRGAVATVSVRSVQYPGIFSWCCGHTGTYITNSTQTGCLPGELLISAGTSWETDVDDQELWLSSLRPLTDSSGAVTSFRARGGNDSGTGRRFLLHVLCARL